MMDNSREGLMHLNKKTSFLLAFDPITEQQEEMSGSSHGKNSQIKTKYSNKNLDDNITKNVLEEEGIDVIRHSKTHLLPPILKVHFIDNLMDLLCLHILLVQLLLQSVSVVQLSYQLNQLSLFVVLEKHFVQCLHILNQLVHVHKVYMFHHDG